MYLMDALFFLQTNFVLTCVESDHYLDRGDLVYMCDLIYIYVIY